MSERKHQAKFNERANNIYDVAIIGAGVTGAFIARELSRYKISVCLIEKEVDVAMGSSKANSAIIHAGYDALPGSLKAKLNVEGNKLMSEVTSELSVPYRNIGSLVVAFSDEEIKSLELLLERGRKNGVGGLEIISAEGFRNMEPSISKEAVGALYAPKAGIVCPYELTIGAVENAIQNGVDLLLENEVTGIAFENNIFKISTNLCSLNARFVVNAAGLFSDRISAMIGDDSFSIRPRKGEYLLMDKSMGSLANHVIFQVPTEKGKGILVTPTVHGNLLIGPNAEDIDDREDVSTSSLGIKEVIEGALKAIPDINVRESITSFSGLRAKPSTGDFIIGESLVNPKFINVAGIESPGLAAAPAIGIFAVNILKNQGLVLSEKKHFNPARKSITYTRHLAADQLNKLIKEDPRFGRIICRCEKVTEGEIVESIKRPCGARNLDAVKRRTRAGMGRCQGGFCSPRVIEILSRELNIPMENVTKAGGNSKILLRKLK